MTDITPRHEQFLTPKEEIQARLKALRDLLQRDGIALAWIDHLPDVTYYSGTSQTGVLLVPAAGEALLFGRKSLSRAEAEARVPVEPYPGSKALFKKAAELAKGGPVGLSLEVTPASLYLTLQQRLAGLELRDVSAGLRILRAVKSSWEIAQIEKAAEQADKVFADVAEILRPGQTELEASAKIEKKMRERGHPGALRIRGRASELAIVTVVSGDSALYPMNFDGPSGGEGPFPSSPTGAGWKKLAREETVIVDMVTCFNGYFSDQSRIYFLGDEIPPDVLRAQEFCLTIAERIKAELRPGNICEQVYETVLAEAEEEGLPQGFMGFGENRVKFFGHGVGLELDEFPILARRIDLPLQEDMVIAVEPKAYLTGIGPVGVEDTFVITPSGGRRLCKTERNIHYIT